MEIAVRCRAIEEADAVRDHVMRRVKFQFDRFAESVAAVVVRVDDVNGPKGGIDKRCRVFARGNAFGQVTIEERRADLYAAIDEALERAARGVARALDRERTRQRDALGLRELLSRVMDSDSTTKRQPRLEPTFAIRQQR